MSAPPGSSFPATPALWWGPSRAKSNGCGKIEEVAPWLGELLGTPQAIAASKKSEDNGYFQLFCSVIGIYDAPFARIILMLGQEGSCSGDAFYRNPNAWLINSETLDHLEATGAG